MLYYANFCVLTGRVIRLVLQTLMFLFANTYALIGRVLCFEIAIDGVMVRLSYAFVHNTGVWGEMV